MSAYELLLRPLLFRLPPERAQALADWSLKRGWLWVLASPYFNYRDQRLHVASGGLVYPSPVGLAAGYDKNCEFLGPLLDLGFGFVVGGTVLPQPKQGNPRPRLLRLPAQRSIINSLGFPGKGAVAASTRLERMRRRARWMSKPVVVSVAGLTLDEFRDCHSTLEPVADAVELNVSSPNTQGIRIFQEPDTFAQLLDAINGQRTKPIFVKLPPYSDDQGRDHVLALVRIAREKGVEGLTASNTRPVETAELAVGRGGLSGQALLEDTVRTVAEVRTEAGPSMSISACGGISTVEDTLRVLRAGANTVQLLTGLVYRGPGIARSINRGLVKHMKDRGVASLSDLVQAGVS